MILGSEELDLSLILSTGVVVLLSYLWYRRWVAQKQYPDGPFALPVIGNLHQLIYAGGMPKFLKKYSNIYGDVFTIELAGVPRVVISGPQLLHFLFVKNSDATSERSTSTMEPVVRKEAEENPGLIWAQTPHWKDLRTFVIAFLRAEGMGKLSLESKILEEFATYKKAFVEDKIGKPIDIQESLPLAMSDIISAMCFGERFDYNDPVFRRMLKETQLGVNASIQVAMTSTIPLIKYCPGDLTGAAAAVKFQEYLLTNMQKLLDKQKDNLDPEHPKSLIHHYLIHREKELKKDPNTVFTEGNLRSILVQLFVAGTDTTLTALRWALLYMCKRQDVQLRVMEEIDQQIGLDRSPSYTDRTSMPYTQAVLTEVLRVGNIVPTALPHTLDKELCIQGKTLPAGCELMLNMASALHNGEAFKDPELFNPDRFILDSELAKSQSNIPFSLGRRVCIGEGLARMEFFLFFTSFLQHFTVSLPEGEDDISLEGTAGLTNGPVPYKIIFKAR